MSEDKQSASQAAGALIDSAMKLSASVAQVVAEAATGKPQNAQPGDTHLQTIVRHGTAAASGIVSTVTSAARATRATENGEDAPFSTETLPTIVAGASLRVPLSVDNPTADAMSNLNPVLTELVHSDYEDGQGWNVSFEPEVFTVAPQDFEKLVVHVAVPEHAKEGLGTVTFSLGEASAPVTIRFRVVRG